MGCSGYLRNFKILIILTLTFICGFPCALGLERLWKMPRRNYVLIKLPTFVQNSVNKKESRKCKKQCIILVLYPSKMWQYCQQKSKCGSWQWTNFSIIDGLIMKGSLNKTEIRSISKLKVTLRKVQQSVSRNILHQRLNMLLKHLTDHMPMQSPKSKVYYLYAQFLILFHPT